MFSTPPTAALPPACRSRCSASKLPARRPCAGSRSTTMAAPMARCSTPRQWPLAATACCSRWRRISGREGWHCPSHPSSSSCNSTLASLTRTAITTCPSWSPHGATAPTGEAELTSWQGRFRGACTARPLQSACSAILEIMMTLRRSLLALAIALPLTAHAAWPEKPVRIVVTFAAGGASDIVARTVSEPLAKLLGQPVIVDNKPGAGGTIGGNEVARAAADGYTLMLSNSTPLSIGPYTMTKQPYDPVKQFSHIAMLGV